MDGIDQGGKLNGYSGTEEVESEAVEVRQQFDEGRRMAYARAGFSLPRPNTFLDAERFWYLIREGWRFVVDLREGNIEIVAYTAPPLSDRLAVLTDNAQMMRKQLSGRGRKTVR